MGLAYFLRSLWGCQLHYDFAVLLSALIPDVNPERIRVLGVM
jgi:hypothetical protein